MACAATNSHVDAVPTAEVLGAYQYVAVTAGQQPTGVLRLLADTVLLEPRDGYCKAEPIRTLRTQVSFARLGVGSFDSFSLTVDRRNPLTQSTWHASTLVERQRRVCVRYVTDARGNRTCVEEGYESYTVSVPRSGRLELKRLGPPG